MLFLLWFLLDGFEEFVVGYKIDIDMGDSLSTEIPGN